MALFFRRDFSAEFDQLTKRMETLKQALNAKNEEMAESNSNLAKKFARAELDLTLVIKNYKQAISNSSSDSEKKKLLNSYEEVINCFEAIKTSPNNHQQVSELIEKLQQSNKNLPSKETLNRIGHALAALFWLGVLAISIVSLTVSLATIPADPVGGIAFSMISGGLLGYAYYKMFDNFDATFETKYTYENQRQINADNIQFLQDLDEAYPVETPSVSV